MAMAGAGPPSVPMEAKLVPGNWVKIERSHERFWCEILKVGRGDGTGVTKLEVRVDNDLVSPSASLLYGDTLHISADELMDVLTMADRNEFARTLLCAFAAQPPS